MLPPNVVGRDAFERSFNFSDFPNLQEVDFGVHWVSGSLLWIPLAFSTLGRTTSPRLSVVRLELARSPSVYRSTETLVQVLGDDLRRVADEVTRIEQEFEGAVDLTVVRGLGFKEALDALNVRFCFCERCLCVKLHSTPADSSAVPLKRVQRASTQPAALRRRVDWPCAFPTSYACGDNLR